MVLGGASYVADDTYRTLIVFTHGFGWQKVFGHVMQCKAEHRGPSRDIEPHICKKGVKFFIFIYIYIYIFAQQSTM